MSWTKSGLFLATMKDAVKDAAAINLDAETHKVALFSNVPTPDFEAARASAAYGVGEWLAAREVHDSAGWPAGGILLTGTTVTSSGGILTWDAPDPSATGTTLSGAYGALIYADALTTPQADAALAAIWFGGSGYSTSGGTFTITLDAGGICAIRLVPA